MVGTPGIEADVEVVPHRGVALRHDAQRETGVRVSHAGPPLRRVIPGPHRPEGEGEDCPILDTKGDRQRLPIDDGDELRGVDALALTPGSDDVDVRVSQLGAAEQHPYAVGLRRIEAELTRLPVDDVLLIFGVDPHGRRPSARVGAEGGDQRIARSAGPHTDLDFQCQSADERPREGRRRDHGWQEVEPRRAADVGGIGDLKPGPPGCRGGRGLVRAAQGEDARHERRTYRQRSHGTLLSPMREPPQRAAVSGSSGTGGYRQRGRGPGRAAAAAPEGAGPRSHPANLESHAAARHLLSSLNCGLSTWLSLLRPAGLVEDPGEGTTLWYGGGSSPQW